MASILTLKESEIMKRQYPRLVSKGQKDRIQVIDEDEERAASAKGYESHWNTEINKIQKGTDKEILRVSSVKGEEPEKAVPASKEVTELTPAEKRAITMANKKAI